MMAAVSHASERVPMVVGKPSELLWKVIQHRFNLSQDDAVMVGDRIDTDLRFARNAGIPCLLMLSGGW